MTRRRRRGPLADVRAIDPSGRRAKVLELGRPSGRGSSGTTCALVSKPGLRTPVRAQIKWRGAAAGEMALLCEWIVSRIAGLWGAPVAEAWVVDLPREHTRVGTDEFWDLLTRSVGPNLALEWIEGHDAKVTQVDAPTRRWIVAVDLFFGNFDRSETNSNLMRDHDGRVWLVDHEACRGWLDGATHDWSLPPNHALRERSVRKDLGGWRPTRLDAATVHTLLADIPGDWIAALGLSATGISGRLADRLDAFCGWLDGGPERDPS